MVEIPDEIDKLISKVAQETGKTKSEILRQIFDKIEDLADDREPEDDLEARIKRITGLWREIGEEGRSKLSDMIHDFTGAILQTKLIEKLGGSDDGFSMRELMKLIYPFLMMRIIDNLSKPQMDPYQMIMIQNLMNQARQGDTQAQQQLQEILRRYEETQRNTQQLLQNIMQQLIWGKKLEEVQQTQKQIIEQVQKANEEKLNKLKEEFVNKLKDLSESIRDIYYQLQSGQANNSLYHRIQEIKAELEGIKEAAELLGLTKQPITTPEGKINIGAILQELFKTVRDLGKVYALRQAPPPQPVQPIQQPPQIEIPKPEEPKPVVLEEPKEVVKEETPKVEEPKEEFQTSFVGTPVEETLKQTGEEIGGSNINIESTESIEKGGSGEGSQE